MTLTDPAQSSDHRPGVSPAIDAFLAVTDAPTPFVVLDLEVVADRYLALRRAVPTADVYYAVKANPAAPVLARLAALGSSFDVASPAEIDDCLAVGVPPERISYGTTIKKRRDVAYAASVGVTRFAVDCPQELDKVADAAPGAVVSVRLFHDCGGADWPLSRKFGCSTVEAEQLLVACTDGGMACGVSFHVGSQQRDLTTWHDTLGVVADVFRRARHRGARPTKLNLGGGFPGSYRDAAPTIGAYGRAVTDALATWFPAGENGLDEVLVEPGRYLVADAGVLRSEVVLVSRRSVDGEEARWVYLDVGKFHGLAETMDEAIRYRLRTGHDGGPTAPAVLAGPTCDSVDVLYEKSGYELPLALGEGDRVDILSTGAYTTTYSSVGFNGFPPLAEHFIG